jgi:hypothetical protein
MTIASGKSKSHNAKVKLPNISAINDSLKKQQPEMLINVNRTFSGELAIENSSQPTGEVVSGSPLLKP